MTLTLSNSFTTAAQLAASNLQAAVEKGNIIHNDENDTVNYSSCIISNGQKVSYTYAKVLYDYSPREHDELQLEEDDIVRVASQEEKDGWLYGTFETNSLSFNHFLLGESNGVWGYFPKSYVEFLTEEQIKVENIEIPTAIVAFSEPEESKTSDLPKENKSWYSKYMKMPARNDKKSSFKDNGESPVAPQPLAVEQVPLKHSREDSNSLSIPGGDSTLENQRRRSASQSKGLLSLMGKSSVPELLKKDSNATLLSPVKTVSIVGAPAAVKQRWVDVMGGSDAVEKLEMSKKEIQRQEVIYEILTTEKDFVDDLNIIIELYLNGLKKNKLLRQKDLSVIFSNIESILPINQKLLQLIEERFASDKNVVNQLGDIFIQVADYLKIYAMYCSNHPHALVKLQSVRQNKNVAKFLDELIKNTDPSHVDSENLTKALGKIELVVTYVNENGKLMDNVNKMLELQARFLQKINIVDSTRLLLKNGSLDIVTASGEKKKREVYLFNDMLLVAKSHGDDKLKLVTTVPFDMILINSFADNPEKENMIEIIHIGTSKFYLQCDALFTKQQWMKSLSEATESWLQRKQNSGLKKPMPEKSTSAVDVEKIQSPSEEKVISKPLEAISPSTSVIETAVEIVENSNSEALEKSKEFVDSNIKVELAIKKKSSSSTITPTTRLTKPNSLLNLANLSSNENKNDSESIASQIEKPQLPKTIKDNSVNIVPELPKKKNFVKDNLKVDSNSQQLQRRTTVGESASPVSTTYHTSSHVGKLSANPFIIQDQTLLKVPRPPTTNVTKQHVRASTTDAAVSNGNLKSSLENVSSTKINSEKPKTGSVGFDDIKTTEVINLKHLKCSSVDASVMLSSKGSINKGSNAQLLLKSQNNLLSNFSSTGSVNELTEDFDTFNENLSRDLKKSNKKNHVSKRPVQSATITHVVRLAGTSKDYAYVIKVNYVGATNSENTVRHTYDEFFDFHMNLLGHFPEEAGVAPLNGEKKDRIIPELPGQMMFVSENAAQGRMILLQQYVMDVLKLPPKIRRSPLVLNFFN
ncbi:hypothetical protein HK099_000747 [Clydaea vesicula]|uniref:Uncharacterized protein n=1 Tax=Clydaea vesicula TaxID=447962 RepID=A0AAD5U480_9FUNG|nr:hypothetical protein HK099_000747 [Clydaea vesicula]